MQVIDHETPAIAAYYVYCRLLWYSSLGGGRLDGTQQIQQGQNDDSATLIGTRSTSPCATQNTVDWFGEQWPNWLPFVGLPHI